MCGIIGFTGNIKAQDILLTGLEKLEYRGYDSAGIAYFKENGKISIRKTAGKVKDLRAICDDNDATCGIGHTRWATHGGVTNANAHPHKSGNVALIHNGIIENYHELATTYDLEDRLISETDTEVAAALFDKFYDGENPIEAIKEVIPLLKGSFAFCIMFENRPGVIYAVRNVSPMVAATSKEGSFIASDLTAFIEYSKRYFIVPEYAILTLEANKIDLQDLNGNTIEPEFLEVDWDMTAAQKEGYPTFMLKEINEQPAAINRTIMPRIKDGLPSFEEDGIPDSFFADCNDITIVACGTAMYAGMVGKTLMQDILGIPVTVAIASEFRYERPVITDKSVVIVVSQSGETIDTLEALRLAKTKTNKTLSIVNVKGSSIARESNYVLYTHAGPEIAVASTKAFSAQVVAMYLLTLHIAQELNKISPEEFAEIKAALEELPSLVNNILTKAAPAIEKFTQKYIHSKNVFYIGRGLDYIVGMEGSLKLKEIAYLHSEPYAAGELKHGPIALIEDSTLVVGIVTQEDLFEKTVSNIREVKARGAKVLAIAMSGNTEIEKYADDVIYIPRTHWMLTSLLANIPQQLFAYYMARDLGNDVDKPRNLAKSVTVE